jgi:hypothetical protein
MSTHRPHRIDRETAEQLLSGVPADRSAATDPLARLLAAAAAPPTARELAGEDAALAAFLDARRLPAAAAGGTLLQAARGRLFTLKVAALAAATTAALGGVAIAAGTGSLPGQGSGKASGVTSSATGSPDGRTDVGRPAHTPAATPTVPGSLGGAAPSPSLVGLCQAYEARPAASRSKALEAPAFGALVAAAGGADRVPAYCVAVLAAHAEAGKSDKPGHGTKPTEKPAPDKPEPHTTPQRPAG